MYFKEPLVVFTATLFVLGNGTATAGNVLEEAGAIACVTDKSDEKEPEKGHKLVDIVQRCILLPDDPAAPKGTEECVGNYEYMPDGSWKASGTCKDTFKDESTRNITWEEGSHLKEYTYKMTGGTGKYQGATAGGTYMYENLTDTLSGGTFKGKAQLP